MSAERSTESSAEPGDAKALRRSSRRELLKLAPLLGAGALFVPSLRTRILDAGVALSDAASLATFGRSRLAPTFRDEDVVPFERFPYNYFDVVDPGVDLESWRLQVDGEVARPREYTLSDLRALPRVDQNTRLVCVEGWDAIGNFGGARISDFLDAVGAAPDARFVEVECADGYYDSIDIACARHPQSLLCYEMYGAPLDRGHGAPLRLALPTKLGYKQAKYLTSLRVSRVLGERRGYWADQGYSWHAGL
jgi:DMSO/TMAO reductase YedYZ molybdopterin-dependent catalytic subunit